MVNCVEEKTESGGLSMKKSAFLPLIPEMLSALEGNWYYQEKTGLCSCHEKGETF